MENPVHVATLHVDGHVARIELGNAEVAGEPDLIRVRGDVERDVAQRERWIGQERLQRERRRAHRPCEVPALVGTGHQQVRPRDARLPKLCADLESIERTVELGAQRQLGAALQPQMAGRIRLHARRPAGHEAQIAAGIEPISLDAEVPGAQLSRRDRDPAAYAICRHCRAVLVDVTHVPEIDAPCVDAQERRHKSRRPI